LIAPDDGVLASRILAKTAEHLDFPSVVGHETPQSMAFIDSSIIRAHQHAAGGKKGARITPSVSLAGD
jgi:hypothetical protein